jgi:hypothetical protein
LKRKWTGISVNIEVIDLALCKDEFKTIVAFCQEQPEDIELPHGLADICSESRDEHRQRTFLKVCSRLFSKPYEEGDLNEQTLNNLRAFCSDWRASFPQLSPAEADMTEVVGFQESAATDETVTSASEALLRMSVRSHPANKALNAEAKNSTGGAFKRHLRPIGGEYHD